MQCECGKTAVKRGMCNAHYLRWWKATPKSERLPPTTEERFWDKVNKDGPVPGHAPELGPCWIWRGARRSSGHGIFLWKGKSTSAHVVSLLLAGATQPQGTEGCHRCDNPPCVNPSHIYFGTRQNNVDDAWSRGRTKKGENRPAAKLTNQQVVAIRTRYANGERAMDLADEYGVAKSTISHITTGRKWKHLDGPVTKTRSRK